MPPDAPGGIAAVVLAAGSSARMGTNKLLLALEGESVLRRTVRRVAGVGLDPVVVVLGHQAERARAELAGLQCTTVVNPEHARGMSTSLAAGLAMLPPETQAAVVVLADMPLVTTEMIASVVDRHRRSSSALVVSEYGGVLAPPTVYPRRFFAELCALEGDGGGKRVVGQHRDEAIAVSWPAAALGDLDVPADYDRIQAELAAE
jgi:molybdenum cofactor cytidylyltransferase